MIRFCHWRSAWVLAFLPLVVGHAEERPNIVLVMADDQGWGDMAYAGHPQLHTPNFDQAAAEGIRFNRFYAAAPVCSPTRASVLTGRHPNRSGVFKWGYPLRPQEETVAEILQRAGYATAHFGKWHLGSVRRNSPAHPGRNGFEHWVSAPNFFDNNPVLSREGRAEQFQGESSVVTAELALDWIEQQSKTEQPFFCVVWFGSPHAPHRAVPDDLQHYEGLKQQNATGKQQQATERKMHFLGEVTGMDRAYGMIRDQLKKLGLRDNTLLWYTSDNGALPRVGSAGKFRGRKGVVYEGGLLVPAILEWPDRYPQPKTIETRCNSCDILPTLLEVAGAQRVTRHPLDGISLVGVLDGNDKARPQPMHFWDHDVPGKSVPSDKWMKQLLQAQAAGKDLEPDSASWQADRLPEKPFDGQSFAGHAAIISGNFKLHRIQSEEGVQFELYNLETDPYEQEEVAGQEPEINRQMQEQLLDWLKSVAHSYNGDDYR